VLERNGADVEMLTRRYGREIFARVGSTAPIPFSPSWLDDKLMGWTMGDEAVKLQLFRFVDVLPQLRSPADITRHLREYFGEAGERLPGWITFALRWLPTGGALGRLLAWSARFSATRLARKFIAGTNIPEALDAIARQRQRNLGFTVDLLGEATITDTEAEKAQQEYLDLITGLSQTVNAWPERPLIDRDETGPLPRANVSVKLSALYSQFDPIDPDRTSRAVRARLRPLLHAARQNGAFVNFDMEQYAFKDVTLQIFREVLEEGPFRDWPDAGIAIQAYLRDTGDDLERLAAWAQRRGAPVGVRLVKGAYWDFETILAGQMGWPVPVWSHKWESDANFERMTTFLMENRQWLRPALGSHNVRSLAYGLAVADVLGVPQRDFEMQLLYGMADPIKHALVGLGRRVRVYTPYGQLLPGMAYLVRRLLENTANESFLRASFTEHVPEEELLRDPLEIGAGHGGEKG
jgi:RHH-type proline utilization regulon transcriptional repressor/proline dehydrogenase/delta 1-pyrroline-5-carboxylate dehydrogenase